MRPRPCAKADALIDFTLADACLGHAAAAAAAGIPAVIGTTGLDAAQTDELRRLAAGQAIVYAPQHERRGQPAF